MLLKSLNLPNEIRNLTIKQLYALSDEVRSRIIDVSIQNGGHIGASLGMVEAIVALLNVFDFSKDKIVFDVGHQAYAYKILTGRNDEFDTLRQFGGISGFPCPKESDYDFFVGGHAGNAISAACGYAMAAKLSHSNENIISVVGDGVMVNGETGEGLNLASIIGKQIIVINDNTFSISASVGSVPEYLAKLRKNPFLGKMLVGDSSPFSYYNIDYIGAVDGHNIESMLQAFEMAKNHNRTVIVHIVTNKGKGYAPAESSPLKMHGIPPKGDVCDNGFGTALGKKLCELRAKDDKVVAIAAAMSSNAGLDLFEKNYPESFVDVGIAESTAVTVAAALARAGYKPYVAIYSTFLQRAYDQLLYDVGMDSLDVTFCIDRAGLVGEDGESHQGIYDLALLESVPNIKILSPMNADELSKMLEWTSKQDGIKAIRYPRGNSRINVLSDENFPQWQTLSYGEDCTIIANGARACENAISAANILKAEGINSTVINARFISPIDISALNGIKHETIFVVEDVVYVGSLSSILSGLGLNVVSFTLPCTYIPSGKISELQNAYEIDPESIVKKIRTELN